MLLVRIGRRGRYDRWWRRCTTRNIFGHALIAVVAWHHKPEHEEDAYDRNHER